MHTDTNTHTHHRQACICYDTHSGYSSNRDKGKELRGATKLFSVLPFQQKEYSTLGPMGTLPLSNLPPFFSTEGKCFSKHSETVCLPPARHVLC
ncbi:hypothetical protein XENTR_v10005435 [Xenopus tropicalis]|nr:hypothetical protein XENTR_v10005435 [Xenopus tropicalis]